MDKFEISIYRERAIAKANKYCILLVISSLPARKQSDVHQYSKRTVDVHYLQ
jgi:hypothetical protein